MVGLVMTARPSTRPPANQNAGACLLRAVSIRDRFAYAAGDGQRFGGQHRGLIGHADALQVPVRYETLGNAVGEPFQDLCLARLTPDEGA